MHQPHELSIRADIIITVFSYYVMSAANIQGCCLGLPLGCQLQNEPIMDEITRSTMQEAMQRRRGEEVGRVANIMNV